MARMGRRQRWGEPTRPMTVRWPASHMEIYEQRARARGLSLSEYLVVVTAELHGLELSKTGKGSDGQLPLSA